MDANPNHRKRLRILLIEKELSYAELARRFGKSKTAVIRTLYGDLKSDETRRKIAEALGMKPSELWN